VACRPSRRASHADPWAKVIEQDKEHLDFAKISRSLPPFVARVASTDVIVNPAPRYPDAQAAGPIYTDALHTPLQAGRRITRAE
jgi:hypothetical protein